MHTNPRILVAMLLCLVIAPASVAAARPTPVASERPAAADAKSVLTTAGPATATLATLTPKTEVDGFGPRVDVRTLAAMSGGTDVHQQTTLNGNVSDNHNSNVSTGFNEIGNGAFHGATGVSTVIQNSGNSVLIQNATILNVQFKP